MTRATAAVTNSSNLECLRLFLFDKNDVLGAACSEAILEGTKNILDYLGTSEKRSPLNNFELWLPSIDSQEDAILLLAPNVTAMLRNVATLQVFHFNGDSDMNTSLACLETIANNPLSLRNFQVCFERPLDPELCNRVAHILPRLALREISITEAETDVS